MNGDGAKTGAVNEYTNYPEIARRINKATGGQHAKMPAFFAYSRNGRSSGKPKTSYAKPTNSTMNRICAAFDDIGNINMNFAGIQPFNYQMLMSEPLREKNPELVQLFCDLDGMSLSTEIALGDIPPHERNAIGMYEALAEVITEALEEKYGSLEYCYPFVTKALFAGDACAKAAHKKMFWRVFGQIALRNLEANLKDYNVCQLCDMKIPKWSKHHTCVKNNQGFFVCIDCSELHMRVNAKQCRCSGCQEIHNKEVKRQSRAMFRARKKQLELEYSMEMRSKMLRPKDDIQDE